MESHQETNLLKRDVVDKSINTVHTSNEVDRINPSPPIKEINILQVINAETANGPAANINLEKSINSLIDCIIDYAKKSEEKEVIADAPNDLAIIELDSDQTDYEPKHEPKLKKKGVIVALMLINNKKEEDMTPEPSKDFEGLLKNQADAEQHQLKRLEKNRKRATEIFAKDKEIVNLITKRRIAEAKKISAQLKNNRPLFSIVEKEENVDTVPVEEAQFVTVVDTRRKDSNSN